MASTGAQLYPYQVQHQRHMLTVMQAKRRGFDGSDTGSGKTDVSCATVRDLGAEAFIICPLAVVSSWFATAQRWGITVAGVANYESIRIGKYYKSSADVAANRKSKAEFLTVRKVERETVFEWDLPATFVIIVDEAHRGKNNTTLTSTFLTSLRDAPCRVLLLSATITDKAECFRTAACILGLAQHEKYAYNRWLKTLKGEGNTMEKLHRAVFPTYGGRMRIADIEADMKRQVEEGAAEMPDVGSLFGKPDMHAEAYEISPEAERVIEEAYAEIREAMRMLKEKHAGAICPLTIMLYARMRIELAKVPIAAGVIRDFLDKGYSVPVFINFNDTAEQLHMALENYTRRHKIEYSYITGGQSLHERDTHIRNFNENKSRILIANIQAGGVGVNLHDLHGVRRASVIMPPVSAILLKQCLGRTYRIGTKTDPIMRVIYAKGTLSAAGEATGHVVDGTEARVANIINTKLANIQWLNDATDEDLFEIACK